MPRARSQTNKAAIRRLHGATNTGNLELISTTIDELVEPEAVIRTPLLIEAAGAQAVKDVSAPTSTPHSRI